MTFFKKLLFFVSFSAYAAHVQNKPIYFTDIVTVNGTPIIKIPTTPTAADGVMVTNDDNEIQTLTDSHVDFTNGLIGLGVSPTVRLHVQGHDTSIDPITGFTLTPSVETTLDNPTVVTTEIDGVSDVSGLTCSIGYGGSGPFIANGSDWQVTVYTVRTIISSNLNGDFYNDNPQVFDCGVDDSSSNPITLAVNFSGASYAGYFAVGVNNGFQVYNVGISSSPTVDGNEPTVSLSAPFSSIAYFNTGTPPNPPSGFNGGNNGGTPNQWEAYSGFTANGITYSYQLDSYVVINGIGYTSGTPISGGLNDNNDGNPFGIELAWTDNGADTDFVVTRNDGASTVYFFASAMTCVGTDDCVDQNQANDPAAQAAWSNHFTPGPVTRNYDSYGYTNSPITYYSATHTPYTFTDTNPAVGYVISHTLTYGTTPNAKILGSQNGSGLTNSYVTTSSDFVDFNNIWGGSNSVSPTHIGFIGDGSTVTMRGYSHTSFPNLYSQVYDQASYTFPNDGVYRYLTANWTTPGGIPDVRFLRNLGSGFNDSTDVGFASTFTYYAPTPAWIGSTTVTPNLTSAPAMVVQNAADTTTGASQLIVKSTGVPSATKMEFRDHADAAQMDFGYDPLNSLSYLKTSASKFRLFSLAGLEYASFDGASSTLNENGTSNSYTFNIKNGFGTSFFQASGQYNQLNLGGSGVFDLGDAALAIWGTGGAKGEIIRLPVGGAGDFINFNNSNDTTLTKVIASGAIDINSPANEWGWLNIGPGNSNVASIYLTPGSLLGTQRQGAIEYDGSHFYFSDAAARKLLPLYSGTSPGSGSIQEADVSGRLTDSPITDTGTLLTYNRQSEFKQSITTDSNIPATIGGLLKSQSGTASGQNPVGNTLFTDFADAGNTTTTETTLYTHTIAANTLSTNGYGIDAKFAGIFLGSASTKEIRVYLDGTVIADTGALAVASNGHWEMDTTCLRSSTTVARCSTTMWLDNTGGVGTQPSGVNVVDVTVANWTAGRILKITGQAAGGAAATNDIVAHLGKVLWVP